MPTFGDDDPLREGIPLLLGQGICLEVDDRIEAGMEDVKKPPLIPTVGILSGSDLIVLLRVIGDADLVVVVVEGDQGD